MNRSKNNKGAALIIILLISAVLTILGTVAMTISTTENKMNSKQQTSSQALYAADGGVNHSVLNLRAQVKTILPSNLNSVTDGSLINQYVINNDPAGFMAAYGGFSKINNQKATLTSVSGSLGQGNYTATITIESDGNPSSPSTNIYVFPYKYTILSNGSGLNNASKSIIANGSFEVTVMRSSFARYALFTNDQRNAVGTRVWFTGNTNFKGPVHTNGRFNFANNPSGNFSGLVTSAGRDCPTCAPSSMANYYNSGSMKTLDADHNGTKDVPTFTAGFNRGVNPINLPTLTDADTQKKRALGLSDAESIPAKSTGVYVETASGNVKGGIYIKGASSITLGKDASGNEKHTIVQGSTTSTITVNRTTNQTMVTTGSTTNTYNGILNGMIFNDGGDITSFSGTVQKDSQITVASSNNITITNNVAYEDVNSGPPVNASGKTNVLGIVSWNGNVKIGATAPNNINVHATVMSVNGEFNVTNYNTGSPRGTATVLGGVIENTYGAFGTFSGTTPVSGYGRNFVYDQRMGEGMSPPFFPTTSSFTSQQSGLDNLPVWKGGG